MLRAAPLICSALFGSAAMADEPKCYVNWSDAAGVVRKEKLAPVERVSSLAHRSMPGSEVVKATLCEEGGRYSYRLVVRQPDGHVTTINVDARRPFEK